MTLEGLARAACLLAAVAATAADAADLPDDAPLTLSEGGTRVLNERANLVWPRCVEGMQWNGKTCQGEPLLFDRAAALARAAARTRDSGSLWRVPRVPELRRLVGQADPPPGPTPMLFPAAPHTWYWSSTVNVRAGEVNQYNYGNVLRGRTNANATTMDLQHGWAVNFGTGEARGDMPKQQRLPLLLVGQAR